ncbi:MAG: L-glutamate gamma-semialdehyde dehydrogenase, partial [Pseudomonadota bacterium]
FPLAIFTGQISAALAAGNGVLAKPAEATPIIAFRAIELFHKAGVPASVLQLLPGEGARVGSAITGHKKISGVCFTGSTATAQRIHQNMAKLVSPHAPLIAETGGLNAMIVDSTALPEQAVRDIIASSFQSAGQRCSALRVLYLQDDIADGVLEMLKGAMDELSLGDPWNLATDIGPVIDQAAKTRIESHIQQAREEGRLLHQLRVPQNGTFVAPSLLRVNSIADLGEEIFGPVLHVALFEAENLDQVIDDINATGFGLTFGLHTRIDDRVQHIVDRIKAGNIYVNRNQIGAVVGTQPFGGEGLSGTGPKAGGPDYVRRFTKTAATKHRASKVTGEPVDPKLLSSVLAKAKASHIDKPLHQTGMPGPTGESNRLGVFGRGIVLCLGPDHEGMDKQAALAVTNGCSAVTLKNIAGSVDTHVDPQVFESLQGVDAVMFWGAENDARKIRKALAKRDGAIIPMITSMDDIQMLHIERHVCIDTTASGGNTELLAAQA